MDHLVLLQSQKDLESMVAGERSMLAYCNSGKRLPFLNIHCGDRIFFVRNSGVGFVIGQALVKDFNSVPGFCRKKPAVTLANYRQKLGFDDKTEKLWFKKKHVVFVELAHVRRLKPFAVNSAGLSPKNPWLPIGYLNKIRLS